MSGSENIKNSTKRLFNAPKGNIIYIRSTANKEYWDNFWNGQEDWVKTRTKTMSTNSPLLSLFDRHLSSGASILEGGCGRGEIVYGLTRRGYQCVGVDFAEKTVEILNTHLPELDIRHGDVTDLIELESASFDAYYSGGVIEHFWEGYQDIIGEMHRVLKPEGKLFVTFPFMSRTRRSFGKRLEPWTEEVAPEGFYQFALRLDNTIADIQDVGFSLLTKMPRNGLHGFIERYPRMKWAKKLYDYRGPILPIRAFRHIASNSLAKLGYGHTIMLIFQKTK